MVNLVKNALQFSPEHGRIVISTGHSAERVYFSVMNENKDENTSDQNLRSAKMPYYTTRPKGTGLGLAIAEKIIIDHGGTLNLRLINGMIEARFEIPVGRPVKGIR
jgi:two-component system sensor histidine kinase AtoS